MATHRIRGISMARCKMGIGCVYFVKTFWQTIAPRVKHLVSTNLKLLYELVCHSLTHSLAHPLAHSLTHSLISSLTHSLTHSLIS